MNAMFVTPQGEEIWSGELPAVPGLNDTLHFEDTRYTVRHRAWVMKKEAWGEPDLSVQPVLRPMKG